MSPRTWRERIEDIVFAASVAQDAVAGMSAEDFERDYTAIFAVAHALSIIGEAARHIPQDVQERFPKVPWPVVRGMRNRVIHEYFGIDTDILWGTVQRDLPPLVRELRDLLNPPLDEQ